MANASAVEMGVCNLTFGGVSLGYTSGGVTVAYSAESVEVTVDQEDSPVDEVVTKQTFTITVPMAEYALGRFVEMLPGATLVVNGKTYMGFFDDSETYEDGDVVFYGDTLWEFNDATVESPTGAPEATDWIAVASSVGVKLVLSGAAGASLKDKAKTLILTPVDGTANEAITIMNAVPRPGMDFSFQKDTTRVYSMTFSAIKDTNGFVVFGDSTATAAA